MKKELEVSLIEVMLRLSAIEAVLSKKNIVSTEEITEEMKKISETVQAKLAESIKPNKGLS